MPRLVELESRTMLSGAPPIGVNLEPNVWYGSGSKTWVDVKNLFGGWGRPGSPGLADPGLPLTSDGYPLADAESEAVLFNYPTGSYQLSFRGRADVSVLAPNRLDGPIVTGADGVSRATVSYRADLTYHIILHVGAVDPDDPLRDLHLIAPGYAPDTTRLYTDEYLRRLQPFSTIRLVNWTQTYNTTQSEWSDRVRPGDFLQTGDGKGVAWEFAIELANETRKDLWINVPDLATDDYVARLAALFRDRLHPDAKIYIEYSNEVWSADTPAGRRTLAAARANPALTATSDWALIAQQSASRLKRIGDIFRETFGPSRVDQVRPIFGGFSAVSDWSNIAMEYIDATYGDPSRYFSAISVAPYVELPAEYDQPGQSLDGLFRGLEQDLNTTLDARIRANQAVAERYHLPLYSYEGGQGMTALNLVNSDLKMAAQSDPRMGKLYEDMIDLWSRDGGGLFMHYTFVGSWTNWGYWGLLQSINEAGNPKWDALMRLTLPAGDATIDHRVDHDDFAVLEANYGTSGRSWEQGDFNGDGAVNLLDLIGLRTNLEGLTPAQATEVALFGAPTEARQGDPVTLDVGGTTGDLTYSWTVTEDGGTIASATDRPGTPSAFTFTPTGGGTYVVSLIVQDASGVTSTGSVTIDTAQIADVGFEAPALPDRGSWGAFRYDPAGSAWDFSPPDGAGGSGVAAAGSGFTLTNPTPPDGGQVAFLQGRSSIRQVTAGWAPGTYRVRFLAAQRGSFQDARQDLRVLVDGVDVANVTPAGIAFDEYFTAGFALDAGPHTIEFLGLNSAGGDNTALLDGIRVEPANDNRPIAGLADAGFEAPALPDRGSWGAFRYDPAGSAWDFTPPSGVDGSGVAAAGSGFTFANPAPPEGGQVAFLQGRSSIRQVTAGWAPGTYRVRFLAAQRGSFQDARQDLRVLVDGVDVANVTPAGIAFDEYFTAGFALDAGPHTIEFLGLNSAGGDNTALLDGIRIEPADGPAIVGLADAGFEAPALPRPGSWDAFRYAPGGSAWDFTPPSGANGSGVAAAGSGFTLTNPAPPESGQVAFLQGRSSIRQVTSGWADGTYRIRFLAAQRGNYQDARQDFRVLVDGVAIATVTPTGTAFDEYFTAGFALDAGPHTIEFLGLNSAGGDNTALLDGIRVDLIKGN